MTVQQPLPVQHPSVWTATQQKSKPDEWCYTLSPTDLAEIDAALKHVQRKGLALTVSFKIPRNPHTLELEMIVGMMSPAQDVTQEDFQLPTLVPKLKKFTKEVVDGRGFQIIKGVPVDRYTAADSTAVYWGLGTYWGKFVPQNKKAHLIGHVRVSFSCLHCLYCWYTKCMCLSYLLAVDLFCTCNTRSTCDCL